MNCRFLTCSRIFVMALSLSLIFEEECSGIQGSPFRVFPSYDFQKKKRMLWHTLEFIFLVCISLKCSFFMFWNVYDVSFS